MKLRPYKEIMAMSKEKLDEALAPIRARQAKAQAEMEKTKIETELLNKETTVHELCAKKELNLAVIADRLEEIALLEMRLEKFDEIITQLFPEEEKAA